MATDSEETTRSQKRQWVYRPTDEEHEKLLRVMMEHPEFTSIAQVVRESVLRFVHGTERRKLYTEVDELIEDLKKTKDKFLTLVLEHSE